MTSRLHALSGSFTALLRLKIRLLYNAFANWKSAGKLFAAVFVLLVTSYSMAAGASDFVFAMQAIPFGDFLLEWVLALICFYMLIIVFTGDLLTGHSLNTGQMSSDFAYLISLPVPPLSLILIKLFERMLTDYIGLLIMLSGIFGIVLRDGTSLSGLVFSLVIYLQLSLLIGLFINLLMIFMNRFFRPASINNFFSLLGYLSAFMTLLPYLFLSSFPAQTLSWLIEFSDSFNSPLFKLFEPMRWLSLSMIRQGICSEFWWWSAFWFLLALFGGLAFYWMIRLNWLSFSHSATRRRRDVARRWFDGFLQKEMLLLRSDFNVLINAIFMPVTIIILEVYFFRNAFNFTGYGQVLNMIFAAIIYFCMFGPINAVGSEGKSIAIIESLPISAEEFIFRKYFFWLVIAEIIFVPIGVLGYMYLGFHSQTLMLASIYVFFFTAVCVWVSVNISAIFANFHGKILQQRSTLTGKFAALALMLLAAPIKELDRLSSLNLLILTIALILIRQIALHCLKNRLDSDSSANDPALAMPYILLVIVFVGAQIAVKQFFRAIIPGQDTGLWSWAIAGIVFLPAMLSYIGSVMTSARKIPLDFRPTSARMTSALLLAVIAALAGKWLVLIDSPGRYNLSLDLKSLVSSFSGLEIEELVLPHLSGIMSKTWYLCSNSAWFCGFLVLVFIASLAFETLFRGILLGSHRDGKVISSWWTVLLSVTATAAVAPVGMTLPAIVLGAAQVLIFVKLRWLPANWLVGTATIFSMILSLIFL